MKTETENNKLIAKFMGNTTIRINVPFEYDLGEELPTSGNLCKSIADAEEEVRTEIDEGVITGYEVSMEAPEYDTSWDWLMPVVEKCFEREEGARNVHMNLNDALITINISEVYKAVVEFIKWYNNIPEPETLKVDVVRVTKDNYQSYDVDMCHLEDVDLEKYRTFYALRNNKSIIAEFCELEDGSYGADVCNVQLSSTTQEGIIEEVLNELDGETVKIVINK